MLFSYTIIITLNAMQTQNAMVIGSSLAFALCPLLHWGSMQRQARWHDFDHGVSHCNRRGFMFDFAHLMGNWAYTDG